MKKIVFVIILSMCLTIVAGCSFAGVPKESVDALDKTPMASLSPSP